MIDSSTSLLPTRINSANCRAASGTRPNTLTTSSGSSEADFRAPRRTTQAQSKNSPTTTANAVPVVYIESSGRPNDGSDFSATSDRSRFAV